MLMSPFSYIYWMSSKTSTNLLKICIIINICKCFTPRHKTAFFATKNIMAIVQ